MRARPWFPILVVALVAACSGSVVPTPGAPTPGLTPSPPSATAPAVTALETAAPTLPPTDEPPTAAPPTVAPATLEPQPSLAPIRIDDVECLTGLTVRMHLRATVDGTIDSYDVWSTWGGGGASKEVFSAPLPSTIDQVIEFTHTLVDPIATRIHEFGLAVNLTGAADPIIVYALEPDGRCPGH